MTDRTAIDTIKGYFYQFDHTIFNLLEASDPAISVTIEGIEDIDISSATEETAIQCKYYSKTEYNHSVIARPIRLMLDHFKQVDAGLKAPINYRLYGHFASGHSKLVLPINLAFLKENFLTYLEKKVKYFHHTDLGLTDQQLNRFLSVLTIDINASEYQSQLEAIFKSLSSQFGCSRFEADHFFYNNALKLIKEMAVDGNIARRKISKGEFLRKIDLKQVLFNEWFLYFRGRDRFFADLRNQYFTSLNISPFERFFLIEVPSANYTRHELKDLIVCISAKWSKLSQREPTPFCPYVYIHNISTQELVDVKEELLNDGFVFLDGFEFQGAKFNVKKLSKSQTKGYPIQIKFINSFTQIDLTMAEILKTKEVYEFYQLSPFFDCQAFPQTRHVRIQVQNLNDIKKII